MNKKKTYKRELSLVLLLGLGLVIYGGDSAMAEAIVWPIFGFVSLAFGLEWVGKKDV